jgi:hypothetical protein
MPPPRSVLGTISGNRAFNHQLSPFQRGKILGLIHAGQKPSQIQDLLRVSRGAICSTLKKDYLRPEGKAQARSGRPREYSDTTERRILRHVRKYPKETYVELIRALDLSIKRTTIKNRITNWRARRRPLLTEKNAAKRLAWCLKHRGLITEE